MTLSCDTRCGQSAARRSTSLKAGIDPTTASEKSPPMRPIRLLQLADTLRY